MSEPCRCQVSGSRQKWRHELATKLSPESRRDPLRPKKEGAQALEHAVSLRRWGMRFRMYATSCLFCATKSWHSDGPASRGRRAKRRSTEADTHSSGGTRMMYCSNEPIEKPRLKSARKIICMNPVPVNSHTETVNILTTSFHAGTIWIKFPAGLLSHV